MDTAGHVASTRHSCRSCLRNLSRAREKELPDHLKRQGAPRPVPLRSDEHPLGLPGLSSFNAQKVSAANLLYELVFKLILFSFNHNIIFSVENPWRSWLWSVLVLLARKHSDFACKCINKMHTAIWDTCVHGGSRAKRTRLDSTIC